MDVVLSEGIPFVPQSIISFDVEKEAMGGG